MITEGTPASAAALRKMPRGDMSKKSHDGSTSLVDHAGKDANAKWDEAQSFVQLLQLSHVWGR